MLNNLKTLYKLLLTLTISTLFLIVIGVISLNSMAKLTQNTKDVYQKDLYSVKYLHQIKGNLNQISIEVLLAIDPRNQKTISKNIANIQTKVDEDNLCIASYEKIIDKGMKQEFTSFKDLLIDYRKVRDAAIESAKKGNYKNAQKQYTEVVKIRDTMFTHLDKCTKLTEALAKSRYQSSVKQSEESKSSMVFWIFLSAIISGICGYIISKSIAVRLNKVVELANWLGQGDLSHAINDNSNDEIGAVSKALNLAVENIKNLLSDIQLSSETISANSEELSAITEEVTSQVGTVNEATKQISNGVQELSSTSEEVTASTEEIASTTQELSEKAEKGNQCVQDIQKRAKAVKSTGEEASQKAREMYLEKNQKIKKALTDAAVIAQISIISKNIATIASETHMLSLNASIESAKAGEHGKGFAVIANQIRGLADQSKNMTDKIEDIVSKIEDAMTNLTDNTNDILEFIDTNVTKDYELLVDTAIQYEADASMISEIAEDISRASNLLSESVHQITGAMQNVSATAQQSSASSEEILGNVNEVNFAMEEVAKSAQNQAELADNLNQLIQQFKI